DQVVLTRLDAPHGLVGNLSRGHLRLQVVGCDVAWGGNQHTVFAWIGLLVAAVEEVRDVSVLLSLGDAELLEPTLADELWQDARQAERGKGHRVREGLVVRGHRRE